ncbi:MAG: site-specific DNA-methyltransferase, partial [Brevinematales bacterium]|nr:site-specific DNA-methyltransferase [Brevinematales bacterium]
MHIDNTILKENLSFSQKENTKFEAIIDSLKQDSKIIIKYKKAILLNEDALDETVFEKESFDLIITSPPYNIDIKYNSHNDDLTYEEYLSFSEKWMKNCFKWAKKQGRFCLNIPLDKNKGGQKSVGADLTILAQKIGWKYHSTIISVSYTHL